MALACSWPRHQRFYLLILVSVVTSEVYCDHTRITPDEIRQSSPPPRCTVVIQKRAQGFLVVRRRHGAARRGEAQRGGQERARGVGELAYRVAAVLRDVHASSLLIG